MGPHWGTDHFVGIIRLPWDPYPVVLHVFKGSLFFSFPRLSAAQILPLCVQTAPDPDLRFVLPFAFLMSGGCEAGQSTCTWHLLSSSSLDGKCVSLFFLLINFALDKPLQQISDDEDDTHPNVDTPSLFKWRHEARYADLHFYFFFQPGTHFFSPLSNLSTSHSFGFLSPIFCKHLGVRSATIQKWAVARSRQGLVWFGPCEQQHFAICAVVAPLSNSSPFLKPTFFFPPFI